MYFDNRAKFKRRGVVLILVLGMLALMALIGVTFATFAGQSLVNNRNFAQSVSFPSSEQVMDYALAQLINDTNNPTSALRGHSLTRDMYGSDSLLSGNTADFRGLLTGLPGGVPLSLTSVNLYSTWTNAKPFDLRSQFQYVTNIPVFSLNPGLYNADFTRWIVRINRAGPGFVSSTYEVLEDDFSTANSPFHVFTLAATDPQTNLTPAYNQVVTRTYQGADNPILYNSGPTPSKAVVPMSTAAPLFLSPSQAVFFTLDGRYMNAFNGSGLTRHNPAGVPYNNAAYANFRTNGNLLTFSYNNAVAFTSTAFGDPDAAGMDEDYDACDLENWFLALQSADGHVMIPSFHRPGILTAQDWSNLYTGQGTANDALAVMSMSKILRPRSIDNSPLFPSDPTPDATGHIKYDIDNDGDGVTDSVWLDLGFPPQRDGRGLTFKPLFAFMVIGLNGRLPLNTVGNLQSRDMQAKSQGTGVTAPYITTPAPFSYEYGPQNFLDGSTWSHASHLGFSVNEINPLYALQNASDVVFNPNHLSVLNPGGTILNTQHDNSTAIQTIQGNTITTPGAMVDVVQLRNLLAGTVPQNSLTNPTAGLNNDTNFVQVGGASWYMPNSMVDTTNNMASSLGVGPNIPSNPDLIVGGTVARANDPVMGRWGERNGIPKNLTVPPLTYSTQPNSAATISSLIYTNPVRAGRSGLIVNGVWTSSDAMDDDYDAFDFFPFVDTTLNPPVPGLPVASGEGFYLPAVPGGAGDSYDDVGALQLPVERIRRYTTPIDPSGVGRVVAWNQRPINSYDYGLGSDKHGRSAYFRYFRPAGVPKVVTYVLGPTPPYDNFLQPIVTGPATAATLAGEWVSDTTNNRFHGYTSQITPIAGIGLSGSVGNEAGIAVSAAMPWDWTTNGTASQSALAFTTSGVVPPFPRIVLTGTVDSNHMPSSGTMTNVINTGQGPLLPPTDVSYSLTSPQLSNPGATVVNAYPTYPPPGAFALVQGAGSSLNKDEADEMNLYTPNIFDAPFGPSDLEWLYRVQDVDGASLDSRLKQLAPISFLNPNDGATRRRLFSTDSWELISPSYAPDQPAALNFLQPVPGAAAGVTFTQDQDFSWNSRFNTFVNPSGNIFLTSNASLVAMNYNSNPTSIAYPNAQNANALVHFPNTVSYPQPIATSQGATLPSTVVNAQFPPVITPSVAHRNRKINLNYPLPISNDPAEPIRQKWIRETYELFKAVLPPQAIDQPEELAQLSQFVVNIIDFRDPDCSTTRFVNTDLMTLPASGVNPAQVVFSNIAVPTVTTTASALGHFPYDPTIYDEQTYPSTTRSAAWIAATTTAGATGDFLVQHGMEYNPIAINEVLATTYPLVNSGSSQQFNRFAIEVVNTLTDDNTVGATTASSSDLDATALDGWDFVITLDKNVSTVPNGRPDPITGDIPPQVFADAAANNRQAIITSGVPAANEFTFANPIYGMRATGPVNGRPGQNNTNGYFQFGINNSSILRSTASNNETVGGTSSLFPANDADLPNAFTIPLPASGTTQWFWVYLRRPANPFDTRPHAQREMVVVDSMRFPYANGGATGTVVTGPTNDTATQGSQALFSASRLQPYRGGHNVPKLSAAALAPKPSWAWGYSEQTGIQTSVMTAYFGDAPTTNTNGIVAKVTHSINQVNSTQDASWDPFPFHDRDFVSPAELLLVPGCSPGLFTKQFVYENDPTLARFNSKIDGSITTGPVEPSPLTNPSASGVLNGAGAGSKFVANTPRTYPYLIEEFYYTGASVAPFTIPPTTALPYPTTIGGITGDGWFKLLEFVEVPSSANGAIGTVNAGSNFDWFRQDVKPGLINLNLIIDEEVFFGVFDDPRLNKNFASQVVTAASSLPLVVTQIDNYGYPSWTMVGGVPTFSGAYPITDRGFSIVDPLTGAENFWADAFGRPRTGMKAAFSDFLKLRSGGSGYLFAWGAGMVGSGPFSPAANIANSAPLLNQSPVAQERPFRSLSYPDINYTVMRPAMLPPSPLTTLPATMGPPYRYGNDAGSSFMDQTGTVIPTPISGTPFVGDPGVRNPFLTLPGAYNQRHIPLVPLRRLFQIPDFANGLTNTPKPASAAAESQYVAGTPVAPYYINQPINHPQLSDNTQTGVNVYGNTSTNVQSANLFLDFQTVLAPGAAPSIPLTTTNAAQVQQYLGANITTPPPAGTADNRQAPYFRTEMLQKVMNLTTVRTHQFAVWITVGFFEVLKTGSPALGVPDVLGGELGLYAGKNVRYRSFFLIDRTKAVGFNSHAPQDFRDLITYRRRIE